MRVSDHSLAAGGGANYEYYFHQKATTSSLSRAVFYLYLLLFILLITYIPSPSDLHDLLIHPILLAITSLYLYSIIQIAYCSLLPSLSILIIISISNSVIVVHSLSTATTIIQMTSQSEFHLLPYLTISFLLTITTPFIFRCHHWSIIFSFVVLFFATTKTIFAFSISWTHSLITITFLLFPFAIIYERNVKMKEEYEQHQATLQVLIQLQGENIRTMKKYEEIKSLLGNITHDLKSPIQAFNLELDSLYQGIDQLTTESTRNSLHYTQSVDSITLLKSLCDFMLVMINRALDFTKTVSGMNLNPYHQTANISEMMLWVKQLCNRSLYPIPIVIEPLPLNVCTHIITDPQWFKENLVCLVSNAQKFSPEGAVTMRCLLTDSDHIRVEVEDSGIGIPEDKMAQLFQPFQQAQLMAGGTGLGLFSLSKRVSYLGGSCGVRKRDDGRQGSCFWFTINYRPDHEAAAISPVVCQEENVTFLEFRNDLKFNILLVEDSPLIQKTTSRILRKEGHVVEIVNNGLECVKMLSLHSETFQYDVILMDLHMPVMDGLEATQRIRSIERSTGSRKQVIIGLSANSDESTIEKALAVGMDHFLSKPLKIPELYSLLKHRLPYIQD